MSVASGPRVGVGALILQAGQLLLAERRGSHGAGTFGSVGGHVEFGESPVEALKREAMEELGITLGKVKFLTCINFTVEGKHYLDLGFTAEIVVGTPAVQPAEVDKFAQIGWFPLDNLPQPLFAPIHAYLIALTDGRRYFDLDNFEPDQE